MSNVIPQDDQERKDAPMFRGLLGYFPWALFQVAKHSLVSDRKHNPGNVDGPNWARGKSADHADCIVRHLAEAHTNPLYHLTAIAWRALALLQEYGEREHGAEDGVSCRRPEPQPSVLAEATVALAEKKEERWGLFEDDRLYHGQVTKLTSERQARMCPQFRPGSRVARIELAGFGLWREVK